MELLKTFIFHCIVSNDLLGDLGERREALLVEIVVVAEVDEDLAGARVRPPHRKGDRAPRVRLLHWVVLDEEANELFIRNFDEN